MLLGVVFVLAMAACGFVAGAFIGGRFFVPPGSGLAGPAIAAGYGVIGAAVAGIVGVFLAWYLSPRWFLGVALPVTITGVALMVIAGNLYLRSKAELQAQLDEAYAGLNKFRVTLIHADVANAAFRRFDADWGRRAYAAITGDGRTCAAALSGREAAALLEALRGVESLLLKHASPCAATPGTAEQEIEWFIPEARPPDSEGRLAVTAACAARHPALDRPFAVAAEIFQRGDHPKKCA